MAFMIPAFLQGDDKAHVLLVALYEGVYILDKIFRV